MANGHCGLAEDELLIQAEKLLEIPADTLAEALQAELASGEVVADLIDARRCIFLAYLWRAERLIASRLKALIQERPPWPTIDCGASHRMGRKKVRGEPWRRVSEPPSRWPWPISCWL